MDIQLLDSWIREHLDTNAKPSDLARCMSLCGPSIERMHPVKVNGKPDFLYEIEVTTNRVDMMSVRGIAREASVILPEFGYKAKLKPVKLANPSTPKKTLPLKIKSDSKLTYRAMGIILEVDKIGNSPKWIKERLEQTGIRSLNTAVDITNYVMTEIGHPTHVFDYDLIKPSMKLRESKKGEKIVSLENKEYTLPGGDIVIENDEGEIIDLPGIIGTKNSVVNADTKRILFFLESNDPVRIRKTSMTLNIRTVAATLNEKGVDTELAEVAMLRGIELFQELMNAKVMSKVYDIYDKKYDGKTIKVTHEFIEKLIGIKIKPARIKRILKALGFGITGTKTYEIDIPSFRARDIEIPEDVVEEIARIYGYHNLEGRLMEGTLPTPRHDTPFDFEMKVKRHLKGVGANEMYSYSMVGKEDVDKGALRIRNPLGTDTEYMRTSLMPSLIKAAKDNMREKDGFHIFELSNIYVPRKGKLPEEKSMLAGIFGHTSYRDAKGAVESIFETVNIDVQFRAIDKSGFAKMKRVVIRANDEEIGHFGQLNDSSHIYYEIDMEKLKELSKPYRSYSPIPKYPAQIEDMTIQLADGERIGRVMETIDKVSDNVVKVELVDVYKNAYTVRIWYQDDKKTLTDNEVSEIRKEVIATVKEKYSAHI